MDNDEKVLGEPEAMAEGEAAEEQQTVQDVQPAGENGQPEVEASSAGEPAVAQEAPDTPPDDAPEADEVAAPLEAEPEAEAAVPVDAGEVDEEPELTDEQVFLQYISGEGAVEGTVALIEKGQLVTGTITSISDQQIYVDIGAKTEGVIQSRDLGRLDREVIDALEVGQEIQVYVLTLEGPGDHPVLSLSRALEEQDWEQAEAYLVSKEAYASRITGYNKGGLIVPFGRIRGFVPASQVSMERRRRDGGEQPSDRWGSMVGEEISVKVIEVDRGRNRLILSERAAAQEQRARRRQELFEELEVGQIREGRVVRLTDFGAFVDIGGADGLIHLSELSWRHVDHPKEVLKTGDQVKVEVISIDRERQRIGLSRKNVMPDPWDDLAQSYRAGQLVQGKITKLAKFGAFASLVEQPAIEGLIHISELADHRVAHPRDVVNEGDVLTLRILRIEPDRRRLGLSLKRVDSPEYMDEDWEDFGVKVGNDD